MVFLGERMDSSRGDVDLQKEPTLIRPLKLLVVMPHPAVPGVGSTQPPGTTGQAGGQRWGPWSWLWAVVAGCVAVGNDLPCLFLSFSHLWNGGNHSGQVTKAVLKYLSWTFHISPSWPGTVGSIWEPGVTTKQGPPFYNCKKPNSAVNLNMTRKTTLSSGWALRCGQHPDSSLVGPWAEEASKPCPNCCFTEMWEKTWVLF